MPPYHDILPALPAAPAPIEIGLAPTLARVDGIERRACSRALQWWRELAAPRPLPEIGDFDLDAAGELAPFLFALRLGNEPAGNRFVCAGETLREALGFDPTGRAMIEIWPRDARDRALFLQRAAADLMNPIDEAGRWRGDDGDEIVYRCVLLPASDDQRRVDHLIGAFSFRRLRLS
jgi:hypothetical protein